jgi:hypothetical protein
MDRWELTDLSSRQPEVAALLERRLRDWYGGLPKEEPGEITRVAVPATEEEADAPLHGASKNSPRKPGSPNREEK